ncbi:MAG: dihydropteroate synthase [Phycisphaerales bacterium]
MSAAPRIWRAGPHAFAWGEGVAPLLMAIVNTTPDSFSDGGQFLDPAAAAAHALACVREGAAIVDVGGESTRPGAARVDAAAQIERTAACIARIAHGGHADGAQANGASERAARLAISIDTTLAPVAQAALDAGACIVNDQSAGTEDPRMLELCAQRGAGLVLMHRHAPPPLDRYSDRYERPPERGDIVPIVRDWLAARIEAALRAGVARDRIAVDPGLGFGKSVEQNFELIERLPELAPLDCPVLVGASRKSFIAAAMAVAGAASATIPPAQRDPGSIAAALRAAHRGAAILRVHAVAAHAQALAADAAIGARRAAR